MDSYEKLDQRQRPVFAPGSTLPMIPQKREDTTQLLAVLIREAISGEHSIPPKAIQDEVAGRLANGNRFPRQFHPHCAKRPKVVAICF